MAEPEELSRLVTAVFQAWQQAGISFLILRNYETLPRFTTNDIDVLVAPNQRLDAEKILVAAAASAGFRRHNRAEFATLALYFSHPQSGAQAHFDLFAALQWRGFDFLPTEDLLARKIPRDCFFIPHPAHEAAASLLKPLVFTGRVNEKYRASIVAGFRAEPDLARALIAKAYGEKLAGELVQLAAQEQWRAIGSRTSAIRRTLIFRQMTRRPLRTFLSLDADCDRLLKRIFFPPGLVIALCGPDGCGKSTVGPLLLEKLHGTFSPQKSRQIHWKPRVFSKGRDTGPETNPHHKPPRNVFLSLAFFAFHWLEFFIGWRLRIFPVTFRGGLVLIDRYYYDFFVDQKRYRLNLPPALVRFGAALLPKPDLVFLLDAPPEMLQQRKQEVPPAETARQRTAFLELIRNLKNGAVVDATQAPEKVADDMAKAVLDYLVDRTQKRAASGLERAFLKFRLRE